MSREKQFKGMKFYGVMPAEGEKVCLVAYASPELAKDELRSRKPIFVEFTITRVFTRDLKETETDLTHPHA